MQRSARSWTGSYIPAVLIVGLVIGFVLGGRAARDAFASQARREQAKAERRAAREAGKHEPPP